MHGIQSVQPPPREEPVSAVQLEQLRQAVNKVVGLTFFDTLLSIADNSVLRGEYMHGGRGEEVFRRQLDQVLSEKATSTGQFKLADAIYERMAKRMSSEPGNPLEAFSGKQLDVLR